MHGVIGKESLWGFGTTTIPKYVFVFMCRGLEGECLDVVGEQRIFSVFTILLGLSLGLRASMAQGRGVSLTPVIPFGRKDTGYEEGGRVRSR